MTENTNQKPLFEEGHTI